jgi:hypothetical protein
MDKALNGILAALGAYISKVPGALEVLSNTFLTWPGAAFLLFAVLLLCILGTAAFYYDRLRDVSQNLREVSEAIEEQSRDIHSMRRTLEDAMDVLASLEPRSHRPEGAEQDVASDGAAELLRQELESLRAEILSDLNRAPPAQE